MSSRADDDRKSIKELGWRQGSILPEHLAERVFEENRGQVGDLQGR